MVDELSEIIWAMNPKNDNLETFAAYIRSYSANYLDSTGINIKFDYPTDIPPHFMSAELRRNLFLIIKEALNNIVKHSNAKNVVVQLLAVNQNLVLSINDDGNGIKQPSPTGNGLHNMRRRAEECGGLLFIDSSVESGTSVRVTVTLSAPAISH